jgi:hypothetical protein
MRTELGIIQGTADQLMILAREEELQVEEIERLSRRVSEVSTWHLRRKSNGAALAARLAAAEAVARMVEPYQKAMLPHQQETIAAWRKLLPPDAPPPSPNSSKPSNSSEPSGRSDMPPSSSTPAPPR